MILTDYVIDCREERERERVNIIDLLRSKLFIRIFSMIFEVDLDK